MGSRVTAVVALLLAASCGGVSGDGTAGEEATARPDPNDGRPSGCPAEAAAPAPLPGVRPEQRTLAYWLERAAEAGDPDEVLLTAAEVADHNRALELPFEERPLGQIDLLAPVDGAFLLEEVTERLDFLREKLAAGQYLEADGERLGADALSGFTSPDALPRLAPTLREARGLIPLRCGPRTAGFYTESLDPRFDRNNCSGIHEGEVVQVLAPWGDMLLARTGYALGWIASDAPLGPPFDEDGARAALHRETRPLTRRAVFEKAFALLDTPYGWGGHEGGRDCSRFLLDVFGELGLGLPRHSGRQAHAGTFSVDTSEMSNEREKMLLIDAAAGKGIVLLHFPGHIMLYLGRSREGTPMAIHAFAEYLEPCEGVTLADGSPPETLRTVDRVTISNLELGRGTTRTAFIERVTRVTVIGKPPGVALGGAATLRAAAPVAAPGEGESCEDTNDVAMFRSPAVPHPAKPLRVIVTSSTDPGPVELVLIDPSGRRTTPEPHLVGGPPWTRWVEVGSPARGTWTAVLGDGSRTVACERFTVAPSVPAQSPDPHAWEPRWRWETDTENLYAAWVEQLFDYPVDEDLTWTNLQTLLQDRDRNLLHDHLSRREDDALHLSPDCADLPYFLRSYFSWKLRLPFAFRRCSRGRAGHPPSCGDLNSSLVEREGGDDTAAFTLFMRSVANGVHSASARNHPRDDQTDVYPVPMTREALRPGTVFADPYGHLLVIAGWVPQGVDRYGIMVGADAQPDGTIGRRRFWRGSFLFTTDTTDVGAGFKAWRPLVYDRRAGTVTALDNAALGRTREHTPYSVEQYEGTADDWYDRMEGLINPRPLDPAAVMTSLVDALDEAVARRLVSVNNGTEFMSSRRWATVEMPEGYDVFETEGAWEDFSTPARDMRLLISIDAVGGFPDSVERSPDRFGLSGEEATRTAAALREQLGGLLAGRSFSYLRSDGAEQTLTLADVVARARAFEVAYNPNDCVEIRWAAPEESEERSTCRRRAPEAQQRRMTAYRQWFVDRRRPPR